MISKSDIILLLTELQQDGVDVTKEISTLYKTENIPLDTLKKINNSKPLSVIKFYDKIRQSYNKKHSKMYINIMRSDENAMQDAKTILTTLSGLLNQILQFDCDDRPMFLKHVRADEITKALEIYFKTFNIEPAFKLLKLIKADVYVMELISGHRKN